MSGEGTGPSPEFSGIPLNPQESDIAEEATLPITEINHIEIEAPTVQEAHRKLGETQSVKITDYLSSRFEEQSIDEVMSQIRFIRGCRDAMQSNVQKNTAESPYGQDIKKVYDEYTSSLQAWSDGAKLSEFAQTYRDGALKEVDGMPVTAEDWAYICQNDMTGCQTILYRLKDGNVIAGHTEEDSGDINEAGLIKMKVPGEDELTAFNYPYLLPGGAFLYTKNYFQGTDFLYTKTQEEPNSLANTAAWMVYRLRDRVPAEEVIKGIAPYIDGYALNIVQAKNGKVEGSKILFAGDATQVSTLGTEQGASLYQHNMIPPQDLKEPIGAFHDNPDRVRRYFNRRKYISDKAIGAFREMDAGENLAQTNHNKLSRVARLFSFTVGRGDPPKKPITEEYRKTDEYKNYVSDRENPYKDYSFGNDSVKAASVSLLSPTGIETWVVPGALSKEDSRTIKKSSSTNQLPPNIYVDRQS